jgi:hypothetical protein
VLGVPDFREGQPETAARGSNCAVSRKARVAAIRLAIKITKNIEEKGRMKRASPCIFWRAAKASGRKSCKGWGDSAFLVAASMIFAGRLCKQPNQSYAAQLLAKMRNMRMI